MNPNDSNKKQTTIITFSTKLQEKLKQEIHQLRLPAITITYSHEEAEELGAFEEHALSEEDALEAIEESH